MSSRPFPSGTGAIPASIADIAGFLSPDRVGYVCCLMPRQPGRWAFLHFLEYRHFQYHTPERHEHMICHMVWETMMFGIVIIPKVKEHLADGIMAELGLRAANGVPHVLVGEAGRLREAHFPIDKPNLFNVEHIEGHFVYHNNPALNKTAFDFEDEACERELNAWQRRAGVAPKPAWLLPR